VHETGPPFNDRPCSSARSLARSHSCNGAGMCSSCAAESYLPRAFVDAANRLPPPIVLTPPSTSWRVHDIIEAGSVEVGLGLSSAARVPLQAD
jgi:hypothetical protein